MKHGFMIMTHAFPKQLEEIVNLLEAPNHYFFINIDKKQDEKPFKQLLQDHKNIYFTEGKNRIRVVHGGFSQIQAEISLLTLANNKGMDYFHLISGQDFPCVPNNQFDKFFEENEGKSYMHYDSPEEANIWIKDKYPKRYKIFYFRDIQTRLGNCIDTLARKILNAICRPFPFRSDIPNIAAGWNWFSWHKSVTHYVLDYIKSNPFYLKRWHHTHCCDEMVFHTLLNKKTEELNIEKFNSLRYIEWHPKREYQSLPLILDEREYEDIVKKNAFFCRKIHPKLSHKLVLLLKKRILEQ